MKGHWYCI